MNVLNLLTLVVSFFFFEEKTRHKLGVFLCDSNVLPPANPTNQSLVQNKVSLAG
jgi:hypothetical protein